MRRKKRKPGRPPGNTSQSTRAKILRAARVCFAHKGFGVTTNQEIAERAGITTAAIYPYFDSKVALYVAVAREGMADVAKHMRGRPESVPGASAALSAIVISLIALHDQDPSLAAFLAAVPSERRRHPEIARRFDPGQSDVPAIIMDAVARGVASGEIERGDARRVAEMFLACMMGLSQYAAMARSGDGAASAFAELLDGGLFKRLPDKKRPRRRGAAQARAY